MTSFVLRDYPVALPDNKDVLKFVGKASPHLCHFQALLSFFFPGSYAPPPALDVTSPLLTLKRGVQDSRSSPYIF